jgi:hypothetical protein
MRREEKDGQTYQNIRRLIKNNAVDGNSYERS